MQSTEKLDQGEVAPKPYRKPTLIKGPMLGRITSQGNITGAISSDNDLND
jgi:hypothetical protein